MASFDQSKAYAVQEEVYFNDGREIELLHYVYGRDDIDELRGSPEKVLAAIDEYGRKQKYLMNVGEDKGKIVTDLIAEHKPNVMVCSSSSPCLSTLDLIYSYYFRYTIPKRCKHKEKSIPSNETCCIRSSSGVTSDTRPFCLPLRSSVAVVSSTSCWRRAPSLRR